jgi:hypothetical protein
MFRIPIVFFCMLFCGIAFGQNVPSQKSEQQTTISEGELKQKILSAGRGEAVHIDIVTPSEKTDEGAFTISSSKGQGSTHNNSGKTAASAKSARKEKTIVKKGVAEEFK